MLDIVANMRKIGIKIFRNKNCVKSNSVGVNQVGYQMLLNTVGFAHAAFATVASHGFTQASGDYKSELDAFIGIIIYTKSHIDTGSPECSRAAENALKIGAPPKDTGAWQPFVPTSACGFTIWRLFHCLESVFDVLFCGDGSILSARFSTACACENRACFYDGVCSVDTYASCYCIRFNELL